MTENIVSQIYIPNISTLTDFSYIFSFNLVICDFTIVTFIAV